MRAIRISGAGSAELATLDPPVPADGEVVVSVAKAAICNTDRKLVTRGAPLGRVLGHEAAGHLEDGTPVGIHPDTGCGHCPSCLAGRTNRCPDKQSVGIDRDGGLAGRIAVPAAHAVPLDGVPLELAPLLEPLACCVHAIHRVGTVSGPTAVVGAGAMGILTMWALQAKGHPVVVCQRSAERRQQAIALGADAVVTPDDRVSDTFDQGMAAIVVTAPGEQPLRWALDNVAEGGVVHVFAGTPGGAAVDANLVHYRHLDLVGSTGSGLVDYREARDLVRDGAVPLDRLPRSRTDLAGAVDAVTRTPAPDELRVMIDIEGADR